MDKSDGSSALNKGMTLAIFQLLGNIQSLNDLLNNLHKGLAITFKVALSILWLMLSYPIALLTGKIDMISTISCSVITIWLKVFSQRVDNSGTTELLSSILAIDVK